MGCKYWDQSKVHSPIQYKISKPLYIPEEVSFTPVLPFTVKILEEDTKYNDFINDKTMWFFDVYAATEKAAGVVALSIHIIGKPLY